MKTKSNFNTQIIFLTGMCCLLLLTRCITTCRLGYVFLIWNLFLAFIPYLISNRLHAKQRKPIINIIFIGTWLLFFPNAPYLVTDLVHINKSSGNLLWFDIVMIFMFSITGLYLAIKSLYNIQEWIAYQFSNGLSYIFIVFAIFISGFGIYLGRIERWNSWNIINHPISLFKNISTLISNPNVWEFSSIYSVLIGILYISYFIESQRTIKIKQLTQ